MEYVIGELKVNGARVPPLGGLQRETTPSPTTTEFPAYENRTDSTDEVSPTQSLRIVHRFPV